MPSSKPKLQGYIDQTLFEQFEAEQRLWGLTQSQALERILSERYEGDKARSQDYSNDDLTLLKTEFKGYQTLCTNYFEHIFNRLDILESGIFNGLPGDTPEITSDSPDGLLGDTPEITSDSPDGLLGDTPGITSDSPDGLPSDTPGITSNSPDGLPSDTPGITSDSPDGLPSDTPEITSDSPNGLPSDTLPQKEDQRFVICRFKTEKPKNPLYWRSQRDGFVEDLHKAKTYQLTGMIVKQIERLKEDPNYALYPNERLSYKTFGELKQMQAEAITN